MTPDICQEKYLMRVPTKILQSRGYLSLSITVTLYFVIRYMRAGVLTSSHILQVYINHIIIIITLHITSLTTPQLQVTASLYLVFKITKFPQKPSKICSDLNKMKKYYSTITIAIPNLVSPIRTFM